MKLVVAIIRPEKQDEVLEALGRAGVRGVTISDARGCGGGADPAEADRGSGGGKELRDGVRLEIGVADPLVGSTVQTLLRAARTGETGDGKVFVLPVEKVYRVRTGEQDEAALSTAAVEEPAARAGRRKVVPPPGWYS
jgi:nitrogen regulatory protein P-II 1